MRLSPNKFCPASMASRTCSAGCVFVMATSSTSLATRPTFAAARATCSRTRSRFSEIEFIVEAATFFRWTPIICLLRCLAQAPLQRQRLLCRRCALQSSSPKFHRPKCGNGEDIAGDVGGLDAPKRGGRKSRLEQIAHLLRGSRCDAARIKLFDSFNRGEALRRRVFHRIEILIGEQAE